MHGELCHQMIPSYNLKISKYSKSLRWGTSWLSSGENFGLSLPRPGLSPGQGSKIPQAAWCSQTTFFKSLRN